MWVTNWSRTDVALTRQRRNFGRRSLSNSTWIYIVIVGNNSRNSHNIFLLVLLPCKCRSSMKFEEIESSIKRAIFLHIIELLYVSPIFSGLLYRICYFDTYFYILTNLLYSCLVACTLYTSAHYFTLFGPRWVNNGEKLTVQIFW